MVCFLPPHRLHFALQVVLISHWQAFSPPPGCHTIIGQYSIHCLPYIHHTCCTCGLCMLENGSYQRHLMQSSHATATARASWLHRNHFGTSPWGTLPMVSCAVWEVARNMYLGPKALTGRTAQLWGMWYRPPPVHAWQQSPVSVDHVCGCSRLQRGTPWTH